MDTLLTPFRLAKSRTAQKAYITSLLFTLSALTLLVIAALSYILFYINYIPQIGVTKDVFLQYGYIPSSPANSHPREPTFSSPYDYAGEDVDEGRRFQFPSAEVEVGKGEVIAGQGYDVFVKMVVPRSPVNRGLGNFMVQLDLQTTKVGGTEGGEAKTPSAGQTTTPTPPFPPSTRLLHRALRPVILPYQSALPSTLKTLLSTPFLLLNLAREEETLTVKLFSDVSFLDKAALPESVRVVVKNERIESYDVKVVFRAKLRGWRRIMYEWRILAFLAGTGVFWATEVAWMVGVWWVLVSGRGGGAAAKSAAGGRKGKGEGEGGVEGDVEREIREKIRRDKNKRKKGTALPSGAEGVASALATAVAGESSSGEDTELDDTVSGGSEDELERRRQARQFPSTAASASTSSSRPPQAGLGRGRGGGATTASSSSSSSFPAGRSYLPSPSPTPGPSTLSQPHVESVREGYAADDDTTADELGLPSRAGAGGEGSSEVEGGEEDEDEEVDGDYLVAGVGGAAAATGVGRPESAGSVHRRRT